MDMYVRILCLLLFFAPNISAQFTDDFSDGDFTDNPTWIGEASSFEIDATNRLHLNAPSESDVAHLSTSSNAINDATWEFTVELDFNPTSSNMAQVFLVANDNNLESNLQGYFVRIGNSSKEVSLYRQDDLGSIVEIIDGADDLLDTDNVMVRVRVTRDENGLWELLVDASGGSDFTTEGTVLDNVYGSSFYFGVYCKYTSTRSDKFYFSDFSVQGDAAVDNQAPEILASEVLSNTQLSITFSEPMDMSLLGNVSNYSADNGLNNPSQVDVINSSNVLLTFNDPFTESLGYILSFDNLQDVSGNDLDASLEFVFYEFSSPTLGDVIFNEIMADPSPMVGLPEVEYVEIYNQSSNAFDLTGWAIVNTTTAKSLHGVLPPDSYLILCDSDDEAALSIYGNTIGIDSFTALANTSDSLTLLSFTNEVVDIVSYSKDWYHNSLADDGGYSLERVNPFLICSSEGNWNASNGVLGGTPGSVNSVFSDDPDLIAPSLIDVFVVSDQEIILVFDEYLLSSDVENSEFLVSAGVTVVSAQLSNSNRVICILGSPLSLGITYDITVNDLQDCAGNILLDNNQLDFGLPVNVEPGDIIINEILSNPYTSGSDFVEIYNNTDNYLKLFGCKMSKVIDGVIVGYEPITQEDQVLFPREYLVVTESSESLLQLYPNTITTNVLEINNLPAYNDDEGTVVLLNAFNEVVDSVYYNDSFHFDLLDDEEGVSLERLNFNSLSSDKSSWHSAAETVGFATPGFQNSQFVGLSTLSQSITIKPRVISPDNDGFEDVLAIHYQFDEPGYIANISVFNDQGQLVKQLAQNLLLEVDGVIYWNGLLESNRKPSIGIYILYFEFFNLEGKVLKSTELITVATKL